MLYALLLYCKWQIILWTLVHRWVYGFCSVIIAFRFEWNREKVLSFWICVFIYLTIAWSAWYEYIEHWALSILYVDKVHMVGLFRMPIVSLFHTWIAFPLPFLQSVYSIYNEKPTELSVIGENAHIHTYHFTYYSVLRVRYSVLFVQCSSRKICLKISTQCTIM